MYICICNAVTEREIRQAVDEGATTLPQVRAQLPVARCCGQCIEAVCEVIEDHCAADTMETCLPA